MTRLRCSSAVTVTSPPYAQPALAGLLAARALRLRRERGNGRRAAHGTGPPGPRGHQRHVRAAGDIALRPRAIRNARARALHRRSLASRVSLLAVWHRARHRCGDPLPRAGSGIVGPAGHRHVQRDAERPPAAKRLVRPTRGRRPDLDRGGDRLPRRSVSGAQAQICRRRSSTAGAARSSPPANG